MRSGRWSRGVLAGSLAGLVACSGLGSQGPTPPDYLSHAVGDPRSRTCRFIDAPGSLPSFTALARPGTRGTLALVGSDMAVGDSVELSARYDDTGRLAWVRAIRSSIPASRYARLEQRLLSALNPEGPADWGFRIWVVGGDVVGLTPSVRCPAELRAGVHDLVSSPVASSRRLETRRIRGRPYRAWISLDERGRVTGMRMDATSGHRIEDEFLTQYLLSLTFDPQLHDGIPVPAVIRQTIYVPDAGF